MHILLFDCQGLHTRFTRSDTLVLANLKSKVGRYQYLDLLRRCSHKVEQFADSASAVTDRSELNFQD
jgi:hypothetical protein